MSSTSVLGLRSRQEDFVRAKDGVSVVRLLNSSTLNKSKPLVGQVCRNSRIERGRIHVRRTSLLTSDGKFVCIEFNGKQAEASDSLTRLDIGNNIAIKNCVFTRTNPDVHKYVTTDYIGSAALGDAPEILMAEEHRPATITFPNWIDDADLLNLLAGSGEAKQKLFSFGAMIVSRSKSREDMYEVEAVLTDHSKIHVKEWIPKSRKSDQVLSGIIPGDKLFVVSATLDVKHAKYAKDKMGAVVLNNGSFVVKPVPGEARSEALLNKLDSAPLPSGIVNIPRFYRDKSFPCLIDLEHKKDIFPAKCTDRNLVSRAEAGTEVTQCMGCTEDSCQRVVMLPGIVIKIVAAGRDDFSFTTSLVGGTTVGQIINLDVLDLVNIFDTDSELGAQVLRAIFPMGGSVSVGSRHDQFWVRSNWCASGMGFTFFKHNTVTMAIFDELPVMKHNTPEQQAMDDGLLVVEPLDNTSTRANDQHNTATGSPRISAALAPAGATEDEIEDDIPALVERDSEDDDTQHTATTDVVGVSSQADPLLTLDDSLDDTMEV